MTNLVVKFAGSVIVKEAYPTVRRRLCDGTQFIEVTTNGHRVMFNKTEVQGVSPDSADIKKKK